MTMPNDRTAADRQARIAACHARYWQSNLRIMIALLVVWAFAGLGCGVLWADWLTWPLGGFPLGFWFAQQGSIIVFVLLVLVYALLMGRLDQRHQRELQDIERDTERAPGAAS